LFEPLPPQALGRWASRGGRHQRPALAAAGGAAGIGNAGGAATWRKGMEFLLFPFSTHHHEITSYLQGLFWDFQKAKIGKFEGGSKGGGEGLSSKNHTGVKR